MSVSSSDNIGKIIDKYELIRLLGEGGMGEVYEARHTMIGRRCALKLLRSNLEQDQGLVTRMLREAQAAAAIGHPNIVETHDFGETSESIHYMVMELLDGESLGQLLERENLLGVTPTLAVILQVLSALVAAHSKGIIHRDLKPDNIFIAQSKLDGNLVKLLDFGISKFTSGGAETMQLTQTGAIMGTPYYMSPEQTSGEKDVDVRTDLWSIGVILYQALTGQYPFAAENYNQLILKILFQDFIPPRQHNPALPEAIEAVIMRSLIKEREHRFQSAGEMIDALLPLYDRNGIDGGRFTLRESLLITNSAPDPVRATASMALMSAPTAVPVVNATGPAPSVPPVSPSVPPVSPSVPPGAVTGTEGTMSYGSGAYAPPPMATAPQAAVPGDSLSEDSVSAPGETLGRESILSVPRFTRTTRVAAISGGVLVALTALGIVLFSGGGGGSEGSDKAGKGAGLPTMESAALGSDGGVRGTGAMEGDAAMASSNTKGAALVIALPGLPKGAVIKVDGQKATAPLRLQPDGKTHRLVITARGYRTYDMRFVASTGLNRLSIGMTRRKKSSKASPPPAAMRQRPMPVVARRPPSMRPRPRPMGMRKRPRKTSDGIYSAPY